MKDFSGKRLLVLGYGYLGRFLVEEALNVGMQVLAVSRNPDTLRELEKTGAETFCGMVDDSAWHEVAGEDVDFAVNCVSSAGGGLAGYRQSYVDGNKSFCAWAKGYGFAGTAVYTSSVSAYGDAGGDWVDEVSAPLPGNERGEIVRESERVFLEGMPTTSKVVLRLAGLYGPGRHLLLNRLSDSPKELPGWGDYFLNLVRIEDVVSAIWSCFSLEGDLAGVYGVVDDRPVLKQELVSWLAGELGLEVPVFTGQADQSGRSARRLGESGRPANRRIRNTLICETTGWRPRFSDYRLGFGDLMERG
ncbi:NAD-dependent epimerase/dehydratase family protein [Pelagicoccus albus]|uniref:NAD-dependent epimerase/dehydratase family protein n=1 Tax=Pelagicoccus albus TaxID=415222 RepID=A0A7X1B307_9BACT|nr:NAD-dependent epimerase/dehydratase family protein [Pelagicoccus albus]MBC2604711.1 NAD-dependent epimerase/dehydratase family protein [Pelagicoccus albus]